jgi:hypothetical protein
MPEYRAYMVGPDGHFLGYEPLICNDDAEALEKATRLAGRYPVELWCGPALVSSIPKQLTGTITHEVHEGCMVPKRAN